MSFGSLDVVVFVVGGVLLCWEVWFGEGGVEEVGGDFVVCMVWVEGGVDSELVGIEGLFFVNCVVDLLVVV